MSCMMTSFGRPLERWDSQCRRRGPGGGLIGAGGEEGGEEQHSLAPEEGWVAIECVPSSITDGDSTLNGEASGDSRGSCSGAEGRSEGGEEGEKGGEDKGVEEEVGEDERKCWVEYGGLQRLRLIRTPDVGCLGAGGDALRLAAHTASAAALLAGWRDGGSAQTDIQLLLTAEGGVGHYVAALRRRGFACLLDCGGCESGRGGVRHLEQHSVRGLCRAGGAGDSRPVRRTLLLLLLLLHQIASKRARREVLLSRGVAEAGLALSGVTRHWMAARFIGHWQHGRGARGRGTAFLPGSRLATRRPAPVPATRGRRAPLPGNSMARQGLGQSTQSLDVKHRVRGRWRVHHLLAAAPRQAPRVAIFVWRHCRIVPVPPALLVRRVPLPHILVSLSASPSEAEHQPGLSTSPELHVLKLNSDSSSSLRRRAAFLQTHDTAEERGRHSAAHLRATASSTSVTPALPSCSSALPQAALAAH
ncbi:hypothetical protein E2C01_035609 [Portunus trituberculatus]|uniref:Uncharacterized protein n=1 Tax=Portunus trituberculatus TaxID=210409 RepID=A0A5B7F9M2_PORTR|nr:hypothetical protein [Portunus trituberculatus]